jgi:hypothetical protein
MESELLYNDDNLVFTNVYERANHEFTNDINGNPWNRLSDYEKVAIVSGAAGWKPFDMKSEVEKCFKGFSEGDKLISQNSKNSKDPKRVIGYLITCAGGAPSHLITLGMTINPGGVNQQFIQSSAQWPNLPAQGMRYTIKNEGLIPNLRNGNTYYTDAYGHYIPQHKQQSN